MYRFLFKNEEAGGRTIGTGRGRGQSHRNNRPNSSPLNSYSNNNACRPEPFLQTPVNCAPRPKDRGDRVYEFSDRTTTLPKFWNVNADLYFLMAETMFRAKRITDQGARLESLLAALDLWHYQILEFMLPRLNPDFASDQVKFALLQHYALTTRI